MNEVFCVQVSDEYSDEDEESVAQPTEIQGTLSKWTNYIHGWQDRYIILQDGKLSYYKNKNETSLGCRGSLSVHRAIVKCHEIDDCRFDVCINDSVWYLRTSYPEEREQWVEAFEKQKVCNDLGQKHKGGDIDLGLKERLSEIETYRDIIVKQVDTLQSYYDSCSRASQTGSNLSLEIGQEPTAFFSSKSNSPLPSPRHLTVNGDTNAPSAVDFRGEALTFKATTAAIITSLSQCIEAISQREEAFKKKFDKEVEKRRKIEEKMKTSASKASQEPSTRYVVMGGPDYEEGPHSVIGEDEFHDAVESALDKMVEEDEFRERIRQKQRKGPQQPANKHPLWPTIQKWTDQQLKYAGEAVVGGVWQLFNEDGEMKMYRRELEEDGLVVDPLKAVHQVKGATAHEMAHHFWSPDVRFEWDTTIEQMNILDTISEDTLVFLQLHKRVWPTAQRDALFWSHIRNILPGHLDDDGAHDTWIVCNRSTDHADAPNEGNCVRVDLLVCMVCQTFLDERAAKDGPLSRDDLICKITYCSVVNPGGWAPASVLRSVYKREYPRFLKRFTQYVIDKCQDQPIAFSGLKIINHSKHWRG